MGWSGFAAWWHLLKKRRWKASWIGVAWVGAATCCSSCCSPRGALVVHGSLPFSLQLPPGRCCHACRLGLCCWWDRSWISWSAQTGSSSTASTGVREGVRREYPPSVDAGRCEPCCRRRSAAPVCATSPCLATPHVPECQACQACHETALLVQTQPLSAVPSG